MGQRPLGPEADWARGHLGQRPEAGTEARGHVRQRLIRPRAIGQRLMGPGAT